jgi:predicted DNA-binding protein (UPF0251 family)
MRNFSTSLFHASSLMHRRVLFRPVKRPEGYTLTEAAEILGLSRQRVHALVKTGRLKVKGIERVPGRGRLILDRGSVSRELRRRKTLKRGS